MRSFKDGHRLDWVADVVERAGSDYKGRFHFRLTSNSGDGPVTVDLLDIRWNSRESAARTLATMSEVELRRRLRQAQGRAAATFSSLPVNGSQ